jgi:hypothetical protein
VSCSPCLGCASRSSLGRSLAARQLPTPTSMLRCLRPEADLLALGSALRGLWNGGAQALMRTPQAWVVETTSSTKV